MTHPKTRRIKPARLPRRDEMPQVPTVTNEAPAKAEPPVETAEDEAIRRMIEAAYT